MRATPIHLAVILLATGLAGCFADTSTVQAEDDPYAISRQVRVHVDRDNIGQILDIVENPALLEEFRYEFLDPQLVIRVGQEIDPRLHRFTYTDRFGIETTKPLNLLTGASTLRPGDTVTVPVHMFSGGILYNEKNEVVATRATTAPDWWKVAGYPTGVHMAPGSELAYSFAADASQSFTLTNLKPKDVPYRVEVVRGSIAVTHDATLTLAYAQNAQDIQAESPQRARPLSFTVDGRIAFPMEVSFTARNLTTERIIEGGLEVLPQTGFGYDATGKLWWNATNHPVRADVESAKAVGDAKVVAWLTGAPELEGSFSCAAKPRSAQCEPREIPYDEIRQERSFGPESQNLDGWMAPVNAAIAQDLAAFFADDLRPGDLVSYRVDLRGSDLPGYEANRGFPQEIKIESLTSVLGSERVDVAAGRFDTYKVDQAFTMRVVTSEHRATDGTVIKPVTVDQKLVETSLWLEKGSFVPVKAIARSPFDLGRVVDDVMNALDARLWADAPIERLTGDNVDLQVTSTSSLELAKKQGEARFAPWLLVGGLPLFLLAEEGVPAALLEEPSLGYGAPARGWDG